MSEGNEIPDDVSDELRSYFVAKQGVSNASYKNRLSVARRFEDWLREERAVDSILEAERKDVLSWLRTFVGDCKGATVHQYHTDLRTVFKAWIEGDSDGSMLDGDLDVNPADFDLTKWEDIPRSPEKQTYADNNEGVIYLSPSEIRDLRSHVPRPKVRNDLIIQILVQTGLRRGELSDLTLDLLDRDTGTVTVTEKMSKTDGKRTIPYDDLEPELSMWLDEGYRDRHPDADDSPYLLLNRQSPKLSSTRISTIVREAADNAGLDEKYTENADGVGRRRVSAHALRSTFVVRLLEAGIPTAKIMELSGHDHLETVESYANILRDDAIDAYNEADITFEAE